VLGIDGVTETDDRSIEGQRPNARGHAVGSHHDRRHDVGEQDRQLVVEAVGVHERHDPALGVSRGQRSGHDRVLGEDHVTCGGQLRWVARHDDAASLGEIRHLTEFLRRHDGLVTESPQLVGDRHDVRLGASRVGECERPEHHPHAQVLMQRTWGQAGRARAEHMSHRQTLRIRRAG
jgi:hypothetical protein